MPNLVAKGTNADYPVPFQLEDPLRDCWRDVVEFLLSIVSWHDPESSGGYLFEAADDSYQRRFAGSLGWIADSSKQTDQRVPRYDKWQTAAGTIACLCSRTQPGGILVGPLETS